MKRQWAALLFVLSGCSDSSPAAVGQEASVEDAEARTSGDAAGGALDADDAGENGLGPGSDATTGAPRDAGTQDGTDDGPTSDSYQGPCDVLTGGCAEAYGVARAMTASYHGPLFQLGRLSDNAILDIGQTSEHVADMTTWSAFCGGVQSNCVISKIYAHIQAGGDNDLVPSVFAAPYGPDCSAGGFTCAAQFTIEAATGLPIIATVAPQEYTLAEDGLSTGINGGSNAMSIVYNGKTIAATTYCCGVVGLTHKYNAGDVYGTDFMVALAYGFNDPGGSGVNIDCGTSSTYCVGAEEESINDLADYGSSPPDDVIVLTEFDPSTNTVSSYLNGTQLFAHSPPAADINAGTAIHLAGGGDLSQPDPVLMREALFANAATTASDEAVLRANMEAFYSTLTFP